MPRVQVGMQLQHVISHLLVLPACCIEAILLVVPPNCLVQWNAVDGDAEDGVKSVPHDELEVSQNRSAAKARPHSSSTCRNALKTAS